MEKDLGRLADATGPAGPSDPGAVSGLGHSATIPNSALRLACSDPAILSEARCIAYLVCSEQDCEFDMQDTRDCELWMTARNAAAYALFVERDKLRTALDNAERENRRLREATATPPDAATIAASLSEDRKRDMLNAIPLNSGCWLFPAGSAEWMVQLGLADMRGNAPALNALGLEVRGVLRGGRGGQTEA